MSERNLKETLSLLQRRALRADKQLRKLRAQRLRLELAQRAKEAAQ